MMDSLNGYGVDPQNEANTTANAAQTFITEGLGKVLGINNICSYDKFSDCGIASKFKDSDGIVKIFPTTLTALNQGLTGSKSFVEHLTNSDITDSFSLPRINAAAFMTKNGESVAVYYQPNCKYAPESGIENNRPMQVFIAPYMCVNFVYDLNGKKGPNTGGKDIGSMSVFYPTDSEVVMPVPLNRDSAEGQSYANALTVCRNVSSDLRIPNKEELASLGINELIYNLGLGFGAGKYYAALNNWKVMYDKSLVWSNMGYDPSIRVRCIKR